MQKQVINVADIPPPAVGSQAVKVGDYVFLGGQVAIDTDKSLTPAVRDAPGAHVPTIGSKVQSECILDRTKNILEAAGSLSTSVFGSISSALIRERPPRILRLVGATSRRRCAPPALMCKSKAFWYLVRSVACRPSIGDLLTYDLSALLKKD
jgi:hypothetical protein